MDSSCIANSEYAFENEYISIRDSVARQPESLNVIQGEEDNGDEPEEAEMKPAEASFEYLA